MSSFNQRGRGNYGRNDYRGASDREEPQQQRFPNSGGLFPVKQKKSENSPDYFGNILIADDVLDYILREAQDGNEVQLELSGWSRISRSNTNFTSVKINIPYEVRMEEGGNPTYRPGRRPPQQQQRSYSQQSGRTERRPAPKRDEDFSRGDSMPDFLRDDDDEPPFDR